ncbi:MAG: beta-lactamase family protein [Pyrinomonadaceae bacterium]|nr:beta-lactamase family protein [Pyrinomonadaceae bacterium]
MENKISDFLQSSIEAKDYPSAVYLVAEKGAVVFTDALGFAVVGPERIEANSETIYDLASLTKPLVAGLLCAKLIKNGEMRLSDKLSHYFKEFDTNEKQAITLENLLTHTSGFQTWKPFYLIANLKSEILSLIAAEPLENLPNEKAVYSDLNFLTLTILLEKLHGERIDKIAKREIFAPLNLQNTFYNPPRELQKRIAASEKGNEYEKQMCIEKGFDVANYQWREQQIWGEVHDGNCYFMNGVSGHAGLFSTAFEAFKIAQQFLANQTTLLKPETCELFRTNFTPNLNEARSIAFQLAKTKDSTAGAALAKDSFGHLGFTGTSLWIEPETTRIYILLTNRTHARDLPFANINSVRRKFHELAAQELNRKNGGKP